MPRNDFEYLNTTFRGTVRRCGGNPAVKVRSLDRPSGSGPRCSDASGGPLTPEQRD
jgi:hypothetical protein